MAARRGGFGRRSRPRFGRRRSFKRDAFGRFASIGGGSAARRRRKANRAFNRKVRKSGRAFRRQDRRNRFIGGANAKTARRRMIGIQRAQAFNALRSPKSPRHVRAMSKSPEMTARFLNQGSARLSRRISSERRARNRSRPPLISNMVDKRKRVRKR